MNCQREQMPNREQEADRSQIRDLDEERQAYERMLERQSEASRVYSSGKFRSA